MNRILENLFSFQDKEYRDFNSKLIPNIEKEDIIGVRVPVLRRYEKEIRNTDFANKFLNSLPHKYLEENILHALYLYGQYDLAPNRHLGKMILK